MIAAAGVVAAIIGTFFVNTKKAVMQNLNTGTIIFDFSYYIYLFICTNFIDSFTAGGKTYKVWGVYCYH